MPVSIVSDTCHYLPAELAQEHGGVFTDLSLRLPEMLSGAFTASDMVTHLREIKNRQLPLSDPANLDELLTPSPEKPGKLKESPGKGP